jgi:tRNA (adenine-N(1)-)-methyltransferase non-catalytic subunit
MVVADLVMDSLTSLGKYGTFPTSELIGKQYDITYEVVSPKSSETSDAAEAAMLLDEATPVPEGDKTQVESGKKGKKAGKKEKGRNAVASTSTEGAGNILVPRRPARIEELGE